jgi:hypothetical protein
MNNNIYNNDSDNNIDIDNNKNQYQQLQQQI